MSEVLLQLTCDFNLGIGHYIQIYIFMAKKLAGITYYYVCMISNSIPSNQTYTVYR